MPQTGPKNITEGQYEGALRKHAGVFTLAARELGVDRTSVSRAIDRSDHLKAVCREIESEVGDVCMGVIVDALLKKDRQMARWYAGVKLGMNTRTALVNPDGTPIQFAAPTQVTINIEFVTPAAQMEDVVD